MKKINLKSVENSLTREQLKTVVGGSASGCRRENEDCI